MELISFQITNSLKFVLCLAWRQICHQVSHQIHSHKQETTHSPTCSYLIKIASIPPSTGNKYQRRDASPELCAAKILCLMPHATFFRLKVKEVT